MRVARLVAGALILAGVLFYMVVNPPPVVIYSGAFYVLLPVCLAAAFVVLRRYSPPKAGILGGLTAGGVLILVVLPLISVMFISGDFASGPSCDGFCTSNLGGFLIALFFLGVALVPVSVIGGVVSAVASAATVRSGSGA